jgi:hypothetical protein
LLSVAIAAIDWPVTAWLEGNLCLAPAAGAGYGIHLALATRASAITAAAASGAFAGRAAFGAAGRLIGQPTAGVKLLLANREFKVTPAITASQNDVSSHWNVTMLSEILPIRTRKAVTRNRHSGDRLRRENRWEYHQAVEDTPNRTAQSIRRASLAPLAKKYDSLDYREI